MLSRLRRPATLVILVGATYGTAQVEPPRGSRRTPDPGPVPEEILTGRIACDADGNLLLPIAVSCDRVESRDSTAPIIATRPLAKLSATLLSPGGTPRAS